MGLQILLLQLFLATELSGVIISSGADTISPAVSFSVEAEGYRRIWGSPAGCFYFIKRNSFEVRDLREDKTLVQPLSANQKLISSETGNFFAIVTYSSFSPTSLKVTEARLFSCNGQLIWSVREPGCNSFILSDNAPIAVGIAGAEGLPQSQLIFFGVSGDEVGSVNVENFNTGRFCTGGGYFFAISGGKGLVKFTNTGGELYHYPDCIKYDVSRDGNMVATIRDSMLVIYREQQQLMTKIVRDFPLREMKFSRDNRLATILTKQSVELIDLDSNRQLWTYQVSDHNYQFFHFDCDADLTCFICAASNCADLPERRNTLGKALLLDSQGQLLWGTDVAYSEWSVKYPEVKIDFAARIFTLLTAERLQVYGF